MKHDKTFKLILAAFGAVLITICAWISIPSTVAFTLQTFAIYCILLSFGPKIGITSIVVYILLGTMGVPVFTGFQAGPGVIAGITGGYIVGFIFIGLVYLCRTGIKAAGVWIDIVALIVGTIVCYAFGTAWFMVAYARKTGPVGLATALTLCVVPYIIPDMAKLVLALIVSKKLRKVYNRRANREDN